MTDVPNPFLDRIRAAKKPQKLVLCDSNGTVIRDVDPAEAHDLARKCAESGGGYLKHLPVEEGA